MYNLVHAVCIILLLHNLADKDAITIGIFLPIGKKFPLGKNKISIGKKSPFGFQVSFYSRKIVYTTT